MTRPLLSLTGVAKSYGEAAAVEDLDLDLEPGSFTALLGPSGCGKSTTLQMIAGLVVPDAGRIELDGTDLASVPTEHRPISLVFQKPLLFPHLSVAQNIGFGLRMRGTARPEIDDRVADMMQRVQLHGLGARRPHQLSGGQEQRVALARALVLDPILLLLDEPFSQLDAALRSEMRTLVRDLHDSTGVTTMFVTHDQAEAVEIADRVVLMLAGAVEADDSPERLYQRPPTLATARFLGTGNELRGCVCGSEDGAGTGRVFTIAGTAHIEVTPGTSTGPSVLVIRPEALALAPIGPRDVSVTIVAVRFAGSHLVVTGRTEDDQDLEVHVPVGTRVDAGERVGVRFPPDRCTIFGRTPA